MPKRSEEHTSELQSRENLVCRLLLEKKKKTRDRKVARPAHPIYTARPDLAQGARPRHPPATTAAGAPPTCHPRRSPPAFVLNDTEQTEIYPFAPPDALAV